MMLDEYCQQVFRPSERRWKGSCMSAAINISPVRGVTDLMTPKSELLHNLYSQMVLWLVAAAWVSSGIHLATAAA